MVRLPAGAVCGMPDEELLDMTRAATRATARATTSAERRTRDGSSSSSSSATVCSVEALAQAEALRRRAGHAVSRR